MDRDKFKKTFVILSGVAFLASSLIGLVGLFGSSASNRQTDTAQSQNAQILAQENGYLAVLRREPKNSTALEGVGQIIQSKAQSGDLKGARTTVAELIKIDPKNKSYQDLLAQIDRDIDRTKKTNSTPPPPSPQSQPKSAK
jgi:hypothetical protein